MDTKEVKQRQRPTNSNLDSNAIPSGIPVPRYLQRNLNGSQNSGKISMKSSAQKVTAENSEIEIEVDKSDIYHSIGQVFYQKSHILNEMTSNDAPKQQVELFFTLKPNSNSNSNNQKLFFCIQPLISKKKDVYFDSLGFTASKSGASINFDTSFVIDYYFEIQQYLKINVLDGSKKAKIQICQFESTVASILGSKGQTLILSDKKLGTLTVRANPYNKNEDLCVDFQICLKYPNKQIKPFFLVKRNMSSNNNEVNWINAYKSEVNFEYDKNNLFRKNSLKIQMLSSECSFTKPFLMDFYDYNNKKSIGCIQTSVAQMSDENFVGKLFTQDGEAIQNTSITFTCEVVEEYKFLDYLRGGLQLSMIFGIDYTASNGEPNEKTSLHYIKSDEYNDYQQAIRYCGDIVAFYDYDQLYPVFGYGAILEDTTETSFCFNVNFQEDENVNTIDGVLEVYKKSLNKVKLYGPTYFSPIIKKAIEISIKTVEQKDYIYSIMIILTDGKINDMQQTINMLVKASYLPLSIIIIGIGNADFTDMNTLDSDDVQLIDSKGQKSVRDIVQFVPMNIFQSDGTLLAEKVLEEIPKQIVDYFKLIGEPPREANLFLI